MNEYKNIEFNYSEKNLKANFKVPEGYFENLPGRIQNRIGKLEKVTLNKRSFFLFSPYRIAAAAIFVALLFVTVLNKDRIFSDSFNNSEIAEIIEDYAYLIDEEFILSYIESETDLYSEEEGTDDEMINYILDQGIEVESILNALE